MKTKTKISTNIYCYYFFIEAKSPSQFGCRKNSRTIDSIFIVTTLKNNTYTKARVKSNDFMSESVEIQRCVKQGDDLSSLLFNAYINDISDIFAKTIFQFHTKTSICLMFADDILLFSETQEGLQNSHCKIIDYCKNGQFTININ